MLNICIICKSNHDRSFFMNSIIDRMKRRDCCCVWNDIDNSICRLSINGIVNIIFVRDLPHVINLPDGYTSFDYYYYSTFFEFEGGESSCTLNYLKNMYGNDSELKTLDDVYRVVIKELTKKQLNDIYGLDRCSLYPSSMTTVKFDGKAFKDYVRYDDLYTTNNIYENMKKEMEDKVMGNLKGYGAEMIIRQKGYLEIEKVIFNHPATIVFWKDGTKTVVKAKGEAFDKEKGLAMAITKKALGNKGNYFNTIKKWVGENDNDNVSINANTADDVVQLMKDIFGYNY